MPDAPLAGEFSFPARTGILLIVEAALISGIAVGSLLLYFAHAAYKTVSDRSKSHIHFYFVNLLVSDLIQAIGGIMNIRWIIDARVSEGPFCTAQGIFKQAGDVGVALTTLVIAVHTFSTLAFRTNSRPIVSKLTILLIWCFVSSLIGIGFARSKSNQGRPIYGDTGYWCWITQDYYRERIALEYVWLWLAMAVNLVCYIGIYLVIKGYLAIDGKGIRFRSHMEERAFSITSPSLHKDHRTNSVAIQMLFYPAVYFLCIIPLTITRYLSFTDKPVPFQATFFSSILFSLSGLFNCILFRYTRPTLIPQPTSSRKYFRPSFSFSSGLRHRRKSLKLDLSRNDVIPGNPVPYTAPSRHFADRTFETDSHGSSATLPHEI